MVKPLPTMQETQVQSLGWEDCLEKEMATSPVFLPGKSLGRKNLVGYSPWGCKESNTTEGLQFHFHFHRRTDPDLPVSVQESPVEVWVSGGLLQGWGH